MNRPHRSGREGHLLARRSAPLFKRRRRPTRRDNASSAGAYCSASTHATGRVPMGPKQNRASGQRRTDKSRRIAGPSHSQISPTRERGSATDARLSHSTFAISPCGPRFDAAQEAIRTNRSPGGTGARARIDRAIGQGLIATHAGAHRLNAARRTAPRRQRHARSRSNRCEPFAAPALRPPESLRRVCVERDDGALEAGITLIGLSFSRGASHHANRRERLAD